LIIVGFVFLQKNVAGFGKGTSDPFAVVTQLANDPSETPKIIGKTEV